MVTFACLLFACLLLGSARGYLELLLYIEAQLLAYHFPHETLFSEAKEKKRARDSLHFTILSHKVSKDASKWESCY